MAPPERTWKENLPSVMPQAIKYLGFMTNQTLFPALDQVTRLIPREGYTTELKRLSPCGLDETNPDRDDVICLALEELARHLRFLEADFYAEEFENLRARVHGLSAPARQLGLHRINTVSNDVIFCIQTKNNPALAATLSRLIRLVTKALNQAAGPL